ncbi:MAG: hypothetical protein R3C19_17775 [Planctomycetaceae bacterium]
MPIMDLAPDFKEFVALLNKHEVRYLVVGGYAVAFHGHPRYTKDLDVWLDATADNATRVLNALDEFGFGELQLAVDDFLVPGFVIQLGRPPNRIDMLTSLKGVDFSECYERRVACRAGEIETDFLDLESLKRNKRAVGRLQDQADLDELIE